MSESSVTQPRGIVAYGVYLPSHRLDRGAVRELLGQGGGRGTRTVAGFDEDSTSMAVEAARRARWGSATPASIAFATTAPAYADKTNATTIHAALGLPPEVFAADHVGSAKGAISALRAGIAENGLAVLSDVRTGRPGSSDEANGGDGAAAFVFGTGQAVLAEVLSQASATAEFLDRWRVPGQSFSQLWEERFGQQMYLPRIEEAATRALAAAGVEAPDHVVVSSPHGRAARMAASAFGPSAEDALEPEIGNLGAAHLGVRLADVLDRATPGETILLVSAADGADAIVLRTTEAIDGRTAAAVVDQAERARPVDYPSFLTWRGFLERDPPRRPDPVRYQGPPAARAVGWKFAFHGTRCTSCGRVHVPPARVCVNCGATDEITPVPLADTLATIATYTVDRLSFSLAPPLLMAVLDFDGGGRFGCELTDCVPDDVRVGRRVAMTFRRMHSADGVHNYFWKARPHGQ